jgi:hypothetical protein
MANLTPEQRNIYEAGEKLFWMRLFKKSMKNENDWNELINSSDGAYGGTDIETYYLRENGFPNLQEARYFVRIIKSYYRRHKEMPEDMPKNKKDLILYIIQLR